MGFLQAPTHRLSDRTELLARSSSRAAGPSSRSWPSGLRAGRAVAAAGQRARRRPQRDAQARRRSRLTPAPSSSGIGAPSATCGTQRLARAGASCDGAAMRWRGSAFRPCRRVRGRGRASCPCRARPVPAWRRRRSSRRGCRPRRASETLAVLVPGFLDSASWAGTRSLADDLQRSGRTAVSFDPRGTVQHAGSGSIRSVRACRSATPSVRSAWCGRTRAPCSSGTASARRSRSSLQPKIHGSPTSSRSCRRAASSGHTTSTPRATRWRRVRRFVVASPGSPCSGSSRCRPPWSSTPWRHDLPATLRTMLPRPADPVHRGPRRHRHTRSAVERLFGECSSRANSRPPAVGHDYRDHPDQLAPGQRRRADLARGAETRQPVAPPDQRGRSAAVG